MPKPGRLILVIGTADADRRALIEHALATIPNCVRSVSVTTRAPRPGEKEGRDYHFLNHTMFVTKVGNDYLAECSNIKQNWYGTLKEPIKKWLENGKNVLTRLDAHGAKELRKKYPAAISVFVMKPGPPASSEEETGGPDPFSHVIVNDDLERAKSEFFLYLVEELGFSTV